MSVSAVPSARMNAVERYSGVAPDIARSLTVPLTARSPIEPPGKNIGLTTNESVENASRAPPSPARQHRRVAELGVRRAAERRQEQLLDQLARHRPAAAVPHHDRRGVPQRQRADPALEVQVVAHRLHEPRLRARAAPAGGRGSTPRTRPRDDTIVAPSGLRGVHSLPNAAHSCGLISPWSTSPDRHSGDSSVWMSADREPRARRRTPRSARESRQPLCGIIPMPRQVRSVTSKTSRSICHRGLVALGAAPRAGRRSRARAGPPRAG